LEASFSVIRFPFRENEIEDARDEEAPWAIERSLTEVTYDARVAVYA